MIHARSFAPLVVVWCACGAASEAPGSADAVAASGDTELGFAPGTGTPGDQADAAAGDVSSGDGDAAAEDGDASAGEPDTSGAEAPDAENPTDAKDPTGTEQGDDDASGADAGPDVPGDVSPSGDVSAGNTSPLAPGVLVSPTAVVEGDVVECLASGAVDPDGDTVTLSYGWEIDGVPVPGATDATLGSEHFDKGQVVRCVVTAWDGQAASAPSLSKNAATVGNSPPSLETATLTPDPVAATGVLTCAWDGWHDPDPADSEGVAIAWQRVVGNAAVVIPGQAAPTLSAQVVGAGATVRCVVTPTDGTLSGAPVTSNPATVADDPPPIDTCEALSQQVDLTVTHVPPSVLLVVDRSGSMYEAWAATKAAVGGVLSGMPADARTGLILFPSDKGCTIAASPQVPLGPGNAGAVVSAMETAGVGGSTPMGAAMRAARTYLEAAATPNTTVVLAADGKPSDTCLQDCTGCDCTDEATCLWCADLLACTDAEVRKEVEALHVLGVRTFVVGFQGGFGATEFLTSLAVAGGTNAVGPTPFYDAGDGTSLAPVLETITGGLSLCTAQVTVPKTYATLTVSIAGAPVAPADVTLAADGALTLHSAACTAALTAGTVDVAFGCN